jgi:site-specific recombinase XerD
MIKSDSMLTIWRRHTTQCPHRGKGRDYLKCNCPIWADGYVNGRRTLRVSLKTRDMARARKRAADLEDPKRQPMRTLVEAIAAFDANCVSNGFKASSLRRYRNNLSQFRVYCDSHGIIDLAEIDTSTIDAFRAARKVGPLTGLKELEVLRQFLKFCLVRHWIPDNPASQVRGPRNLPQNDAEPYTPAEIAAILGACDHFGRTDYERLRAKAMVITLRHTGLRIGDARLTRDRITKDGQRLRVFLRTEKTGKPVFLPIPEEMRLALNALPVPRGAPPDCRWYFWNGRTSERALVGIAERTLAAVFRESGVAKAHAHRFRHTLATELLGIGASFEEVADVLGNSPAIVRKHYAKWSTARQARIDNLMDQLWAQFGHAGKKGLQVIRGKG